MTMLSDEKLLKAWDAGVRSGDDGWSTSSRDHVRAGLRAVEAAVRADALRDALPEGAKWFPTEGGIMWQGKVYYPTDYVMTRKDIAAVRTDQIEKDIEKVLGAALDFDRPGPRAQIAAILRAQLPEGNTDE